MEEEVQGTVIPFASLTSLDNSHRKQPYPDAGEYKKIDTPADKSQRKWFVMLRIYTLGDRKAYKVIFFTPFEKENTKPIGTNHKKR